MKDYKAATQSQRLKEYIISQFGKVVTPDQLFEIAKIVREEDIKLFERQDKFTDQWREEMKEFGVNVLVLFLQQAGKDKLRQDERIAELLSQVTKEVKIK